MSHGRFELDAHRWRPGRVSTWIARGALVLWALSLVTPVLVRNPIVAMPGIALLLKGWFAILGGYLAWLANILFFWALALLRMRESALVVSWLALPLSADALRLRE